MLTIAMVLVCFAGVFMMDSLVDIQMSNLMPWASGKESE